MSNNSIGPVPLILVCPGPVSNGANGTRVCGVRHIDEGEFAARPHKTHTCQTCGFRWQPALVPTVGVRFLPGCENAAPKKSFSNSTPRPDFSHYDSYNPEYGLAHFEHLISGGQVILSESVSPASVRKIAGTTLPPMLPKGATGTILHISGHEVYVHVEFEIYGAKNTYIFTRDQALCFLVPISVAVGGENKNPADKQYKDDVEFLDRILYATIHGLVGMPLAQLARNKKVAQSVLKFLDVQRTNGAAIPSKEDVAASIYNTMHAADASIEFDRLPPESKQIYTEAARAFLNAIPRRPRSESFSV